MLSTEQTSLDKSIQIVGARVNYPILGKFVNFPEVSSLPPSAMLFIRLPRCAFPALAQGAQGIAAKDLGDVFGRITRDQQALRQTGQFGGIL